MPEGPEVETVRRSLVDVVVGASVQDVWQSSLPLRMAKPQASLQAFVGSTVVSLERKGKLLWLPCRDNTRSDVRGLLVRLGMTGQLRLHAPTDDVAKHTHVRIVLQPRIGTVQELRYVDPRRFGDVAGYHDAATLKAQVEALGPDGLTLSANEVLAAAAKLRTTTRALKEALLDQRWLAGVGNIYACEALFRARLSPWRRGVSLSPKEAVCLVECCRDALVHGLEHNGTSFSDYVDARGATGGALAHLWVFQRETLPCKQCQQPIERRDQAGRSTFFCRRCQHARPTSR
jgi:formamidopyrimidine-DNA glycosylase